MNEDIQIIPVDANNMPNFGPSFPTPQRSDKADLIEKIKPEIVIENFRHYLMGEVLIDGQWHRDEDLAKRALTKVGASEIAELMLGASTVNVSISKLSDQEIKKRLVNLTKDLVFLMVSNWRRYGIKNVGQMYAIRAIFYTNCLVVLKQADNASIQELLKGTVQESRVVQNQPKEGFSQKVRRAVGLG